MLTPAEVQGPAAVQPALSKRRETAALQGARLGAVSSPLPPRRPRHSVSRLQGILTHLTSLTSTKVQILTRDVYIYHLGYVHSAGGGWLVLERRFLALPVQKHKY